MVNNVLFAVCATLAAGSAAAAVRLEVRGANGELADNIRAHVGPMPESASEAGARFRRNVQASAQRAAEALGYYAADIRVTRERDGDDAVIRVEVKPGPRVTLSEVDIVIDGEARDDAEFQKLIASLPLRKGGPLHHGLYESSKQQLENLALRRGYFDARFTRHRVEVDANANTARVLLTFDSGRRYRFGEVSFSETPLRKELLKRLVPFQPDDPYQAEQVIELNRNLLDSNYFNNVRVRPQPEQAEDDAVPVEVELAMAEPNRVGVGVGYATDVGPRLRLTWTRPWINRHGHSAEADLEVSQVRQSISGEYKIPLRSPLTDFLSFQSGLISESFPDARSDRFTLAVQRDWRLSSGWQRSVFVRWNRDNFKVDGQPRQTTDLVLPGVSYTRTRVRGNAVDPISGDRYVVSVEGGDEWFGSDIRLLRLRLGGRWLVPLAPRHQLFLRTDLGKIWTSDFDRLPPSLRFFAGGDQSIRGFDYNTVAPKTSSGPGESDEIVGGRYLYTGSIEYDYRFAEKWQVATFIDAGNATNSLDEPLKVGAGFGIHWISPVGPVRLEFAWGISERDKPFELHFTLGPRL